MFLSRLLVVDFAAGELCQMWQWCRVLEDRRGRKERSWKESHNFSMLYLHGTFGSVGWRRLINETSRNMFTFWACWPGGWASASLVCVSTCAAGVAVTWELVPGLIVTVDLNCRGSWCFEISVTTSLRCEDGKEIDTDDFTLIAKYQRISD